jgi:DNA-binding NtrC family response regulator
MPSKANIMIVDDEENLLKGMARQLSKKYSLSSAMSGQEALEKVVNIGDLSVIVSDMRMPEMNGIELLKRVEEIAPETIRIMLTGNADQETAIKAINEGNIYRFFTKPCDLEVLSKGIDEGITQYRLNLAEKELIETTLAGSIKLLVDVLDLNYPKIAQ